ncbi:hypothetical protein QOT17_002687 [Balamuthia mandrillaris]
MRKAFLRTSSFFSPKKKGEGKKRMKQGGSSLLKKVLLVESTAFSLLAAGFAASAFGFTTSASNFDLASALFKPSFSSSGYLREVLLLLSCLCVFIAAALCAASPKKRLARALGLSGLSLLVFGGFLLFKSSASSSSELFTEAGLLGMTGFTALIDLAYLYCGFVGEGGKGGRGGHKHKQKRK